MPRDGVTSDGVRLVKTDNGGKSVLASVAARPIDWRTQTFWKLCIPIAAGILELRLGKANSLAQVNSSQICAIEICVF